MGWACAVEEQMMERQLQSDTRIAPLSDRDSQSWFHGSSHRNEGARAELFVSLGHPAMIFSNDLALCPQS